MNKNKISKLLLFLSFFFVSNDLVHTKETGGKNNSGKLVKIDPNKDKDKDKDKTNELDKCLESLHASKGVNLLFDIIGAVPWVSTAAICIGVGYFQKEASSESKELMKNLRKTNEDLKNEILNIKYQVSDTKSDVKQDMDRLIEKLENKIRIRDKLIYLFSCLNDNVIESVRCIYKNVTRLCAVERLGNLPGCFFDGDNFPWYDNNCLWYNFLKENNMEKRTNYAGFLFFVLYVMYRQIDVYFDGKIKIRVFPDFLKEKVSKTIEDNKNLHIKKIEINENSIIVKTDILEGKSEFKVNCPSGKIDTLKLEFV